MPAVGSALEDRRSAIEWFGAGDADEIEAEFARARDDARFRDRACRSGRMRSGRAGPAGDWKSIVHVPCTGRPLSVAGAYIDCLRGGERSVVDVRIARRLHELDADARCRPVRFRLRRAPAARWRRGRSAIRTAARRAPDYRRPRRPRSRVRSPLPPVSALADVAACDGTDGTSVAATRGALSSAVSSISRAAASRSARRVGPRWPCGSAPNPRRPVHGISIERDARRCVWR